MKENKKISVLTHLKNEIQFLNACLAWATQEEKVYLKAEKFANIKDSLLIAYNYIKGENENEK